jgi:arsenite methyltransferase
VSDLVLTRSLPEDVRRSVEAYVGCVAGAMPQEDFLAAMRQAGFDEVEVLEERTYASGGAEAGVGADAMDAVRSIKVRGVKPRV